MTVTIRNWLSQTIRIPYRVGHGPVQTLVIGPAARGTGSDIGTLAGLTRSSLEPQVCAVWEAKGYITITDVVDPSKPENFGIAPLAVYTARLVAHGHRGPHGHGSLVAAAANLAGAS